MDMYVKVLTSMEEKMNRLDSKAKLSMSMTSNHTGSQGPSMSNYNTQTSTHRDNLDFDDEELMNRLKTIKSRIESGNN